MTNTISNDLIDQAIPVASPQLRERVDQAAGATRPGRYDHKLDEAARRPARFPSRLSLIEPLVAQIRMLEARARSAEQKLAAHGRHCICRAATIATEEAGVVLA
ncbi:hypothetical protein JYU29_12340 [Tianweitania sp. BSSL-BM11]|uniref:Uncharacterized protein n=1 Tax=Tianweitania aestuarii TaxID=2814886 RepID=A0ABS5RWT6_9HYPH|nr:hypothetical protein [Tianweitania aestuarii]MBS9721474.1 hypothetical protein [Tianweitania aestuarii]